MNDRNLETIWEEEYKPDFESFIEYEVGWSDDDPDEPTCFGSGDSKSYCVECRYQPFC